MEAIQNLVEYYDELFPISEAQKKFYAELCQNYSSPQRLLRIGCGAGLFEHLLAREGKDVTGIETAPEILRSANLRRRNQLMSIRFFQMSVSDMTRFLGKGFYNIISCLENRIVFINTKTMLRKFFFDCKQLLAEGGVLVLGLYNYLHFGTRGMATLPTRESLRAKLFTEMQSRENGTQILVQHVENSSGKLLPVLQDVPMYPILPEEIEQFAKEAGFTKIDFFADFGKNPLTEHSETLVAVIG